MSPRITAVYQLVRDAVRRGRASDGPILSEGSLAGWGRTRPWTARFATYRTREEERTWERRRSLQGLKSLEIVRTEPDL